MSISAPPSSLDAGLGRVIRLGGLFSAFWRNLWLILLCGVFFGIAGLVVARTTPPGYTAAGLLTVESERFSIPELQGAVSGDISIDPLPRVRSEVLVLRSPALVRAVSDELNLQDDPFFNPSLRRPNLIGQMKDHLREVLPWLFSPQPPMNVEAERQAAAAEAARRLGVSHDNRTFVVSVSFSAPEPELAATFVNTLIRRYIDARTQTRQRINTEANQALNRRIQQVRDEVVELDNQVRELRVRNNLVSTRALSVGQQRLEELTAAATRASVERAQAEAEQQRVVALTKRGATNELADALNSQTVARLREREAEATRRVAEVSVRLGPNHPDYRSANLELAAVRRQIGEEVSRFGAGAESRLAVARDREASAQAQLKQAMEAANAAAVAQGELIRLERETEARRNLYQTLIERAEQTAISPRALEQEPSARVVSLAVVPTRPSGTQPTMVAAVGSLAGLIVGCMLAVLRGRSPYGFASAQEVAESTGLQILGSLPRSLATHHNGAATALVRAKPTGVEAEALRAVRNRLRRLWSGAAPRSVLLLSAGGKLDGADQAAAFASIAALDGERILLVEGDPTRARLLPSLGLPPGRDRQRGVLPVLLGEAPWRDCVVEDQRTPLHLLVSHPTPSYVASFPAGIRLQSALAEMVQDYNLVVLHGPPLAAMSDVNALARGADCILLLVPASGVKRAAIRQAAEQLSQASGATLAAVFCE